MSARRVSATLRRTFSNLSIKPFQFQDAVALQTWLQTKGVPQDQALTMAPPLFSKGYTGSDLFQVAKMDDFKEAGLAVPLARQLIDILKPTIKYTLFGEPRVPIQATTVKELLESLASNKFPFLVLNPAGQPMTPEGFLESDKTYAVVYEHNFEEFKAHQQPEVINSDHKIVAMEPVIKKAMEIVCQYIDRKSEGGFRVPPGVIVSCARSGKTTTLKQLFNAILKEEKYMPIYVTFNGQSGFKRNLDVSDVQDFLRAVITQLDPNSIRPEQAIHTYFSRELLDDYLKSIGKPVVLLVDELNALTRNPSSELAALLRQMFLDPTGRYFCFTSHRGIDLSETRRDELGGDKASPRGRRPIAVAHTLDQAALQDMFENKALNPFEVALYCGIPGLVYSMKTDCRYRDRFNAAGLQPDFLAGNLKLFLDRVLTGEDCCPPEFAELTFHDDNGMFVWPLCYVEAYLARMGGPEAKLGAALA